jgi:uncharacterized cupredoxin-like copper-binding protein
MAIETDFTTEEKSPTVSLRPRANSSPCRSTAARLAAFGACSLGLTALLSAIAVAPAAAAAQAKSQAATKTTTVAVFAGTPAELSFTLSAKSVPAGKVIFNVTDVGVATHDFEICTAPKVGLGYPNYCVGTTTKELAPTESGTISVTLKKGIYEYLCTVPGHANAGMKGVLIVTG